MPSGVQAVIRRNAVQSAGPEGAPALVFAHGFGTDQTVWTQYVAKFSDSYRCVSFDHAGSGGSDLTAYNPRRYSSLYSFATDVIEVCEALKLRDVRLVGHSVSGMVSMIASILKPDLFQSLLVIGASPRYVDDPEAGYVGGFNEPDVRAMLDNMAANYYTWASGFAPLVMGNNDRPDLAEYFLQTLLTMRPDVAQAVLKVILLSDHREELDRVKTPVWALAAREDNAVPDCVGEYLSANVSDLRLIALDATGHLPHVSAPEAVTEVISQWLRN